MTYPQQKAGWGRGFDFEGGIRYYDQVTILGRLIKDKAYGELK